MSAHSDMEGPAAWQIQAERRSKLYALFSKCFLYPDPVLVEDWLNGLFLDQLREGVEFVPEEQVFHALEGQWKADKDKALNDLLTDFRVEYMRLFVGPGRLLAAPYESVYRKDPQRQNQTGLLMGSSTAEVVELYRRAGVSVAPDYTDLPDHISSELEFLYYLTAQEAGAWKAESQADTEKWLGFEQEFLTGHLGVWMAEFAAAVKANAHLPFYRAIAALCEQFVAGEIRGAQFHRR